MISNERIGELAKVGKAIAQSALGTVGLMVDHLKITDPTEMGCVAYAFVEAIRQQHEAAIKGADDEQEIRREFVRIKIALNFMGDKEERGEIDGGLN